MINKQDVLNLIKDMKSRISNDLYSEADETVLDILANKIEGMEDVADTNVGGKWIPVEQGLPMNREDVLVCFKGIDGFLIAWYAPNGGVWHNSSTDYICKGKVIAWMPLPAPMREVKS